MLNMFLIFYYIKDDKILLLLNIRVYLQKIHKRFILTYRTE